MVLCAHYCAHAYRVQKGHVQGMNGRCGFLLVHCMGRFSMDHVSPVSQITKCLLVGGYLFTSAIVFLQSVPQLVSFIERLFPSGRVRSTSTV